LEVLAIKILHFQENLIKFRIHYKEEFDYRQYLKELFLKI